VRAPTAGYFPGKPARFRCYPAALMITVSPACSVFDALVVAVDLLYRSTHTGPKAKTGAKKCVTDTHWRVQVAVVSQCGLWCVQGLFAHKRGK
jgi:hypothetical protein